MKLELKHLAPYLPYGLKTLYSGEMNGTELTLLTSEMTPSNILGMCDQNNKDKPILRSLIDLDKTMNHGCRFIPIHWYDGDDDYDEIYNNMIGLQEQRAYHIHSTKYKVYERLLCWHFDVFGLIEKGLAIDINKL